MTYAEAVKVMDDILTDIGPHDEGVQALAILRRAEPLMEAVMRFHAPGKVWEVAVTEAAIKFREEVKR